MATLRGKPDEDAAISELLRLQTTLTDAGTTSESAAEIRKQAETVFDAHRGSAEVARLYALIQSDQGPATATEPDACRQLRQLLGPNASLPSLITALRDSGFSRRDEVSYQETVCYQRILISPLENLLASYESADNVTTERLERRIASLRELLAAMPPCIQSPRRKVEELIHVLALHTSRRDYEDAAEILMTLNVQQKWDDADPLKPRLEGNAWAMANPENQVVKGVVDVLSQLDQWKQLYASELKTIEQARRMMEDQNDEFDELLDQIRTLQARLSEVGLRRNEPLESAVSMILKRLRDICDDKTDVLVSEQILENKLTVFERLEAWLRKPPLKESAEAQGLLQTVRELATQTSQQILSMRVRSAQDRLKVLPWDEVSGYARDLHESSVLELREWASRIERVLSSIEFVALAADAVDVLHLERLQNSLDEYPGTPLGRKVLDVLEEYRTRIAQVYLETAGLLLRKIEDAGNALARAETAGGVADAVSVVVAIVSQYAPLQAKPGFLEAQSLRPETCLALDQRVLAITQELLPKACVRWADLAARTATKKEHLDTARDRLATWTATLPQDVPQREIGRILSARALELDVQSLQKSSDYQAALDLLESRHTELTPMRFRDLRRELGRLLALSRYQKGREDDIAQAVLDYGPDRELVGLLLEAFFSTGDGRHLSRISSRLEQLRREEPDAARIIDWWRRFDGADLNNLTTELAAERTSGMAAKFARALALTPQHAATFRVLKDAALRASGWDHETREAVADIQAELDRKIQTECQRIDEILASLARRSKDTSRPSSDKELCEQLTSAFHAARTFLDDNLVLVENASEYLTALNRFSVEIEPGLLKAVRDAEGRLHRYDGMLGNWQAAWDAITQQGWEKIADLQRAYNQLLPDPSEFPLIFNLRRLLGEYFDNYMVVTSTIEELVKAWDSGAASVSSVRISELTRKLSDELRYDFRPEQDRYRLGARFNGITYLAFTDRLLNASREFEEVIRYREELFDSIAGLEERIEFDLRERSEATLAELRQLLSRKGPVGKSLYEIHLGVPKVTSSSALSELHTIQGTSIFELLRRAVTGSSNKTFGG